MRGACLALVGRGSDDIFDEPYTSAATTLKSRDARFDDEDCVGEGPLWSFVLPSLDPKGKEETVQFRAVDEAAAVACACWRALKRAIQNTQVPLCRPARSAKGMLICA